MSDPKSAPASSAAPAETTPAAAQEKQIAEAVSQVKEARAKEATLKGKPDLAKIFREEKLAPVEVAAEPAKAKEATPSPAEDPATAAPASPSPTEDPAEKEKQERAAKRRAELAELAKSGRDKWQARVAEKQESTTLAKQRAEIEARAKEIEAEKARLELAKKDPFKFLEEIGAPPEELARRLMQRGDPKSTAEELREEFNAWKREQQEAAKREEESRAKRMEDERRLSQAEAARRSNQQFVTMVTADDKRYQALNALYTPQEILMKAHQVVAQIRANDPQAFYDDSEIADFLEQDALPRLQKLRGPAAESPAPKVPEAQPTASVAQPEQGTKSRTLTSDLQSEGAIDLASFKKLPRSKQNQVLGELLNAATRRKSAK